MYKTCDFVMILAKDTVQLTQNKHIPRSAEFDAILCSRSRLGIPLEIMGRIPGVIRAELARNVGITPVQLAE